MAIHCLDDTVAQFAEPVGCETPNIGIIFG